MSAKELEEFTREIKQQKPVVASVPSSSSSTEVSKGKRKKKHYHTRSAEVDGSEPEQVFIITTVQYLRCNIRSYTLGLDFLHHRLTV